VFVTSKLQYEGSGLISPLIYSDIVPLEFPPAWAAGGPLCASRRRVNVFQGEPARNASFVADRPEPATAIGMLTPRAFAAAAATMPALAAYADYDDWLDAREGLRMGLAFGGVEAEFAPVSLTALLAWARLTGDEPDEAALDRLATFVRALRLARNPAALAAIGRRDFDACDRSGGADDFATWQRRRWSRRTELTAAGAQVFELQVRLDDVVAWCACVDQPVCEATLDAYAALLLELLATD
jgi:hypothetical protein